LKSIKKCKVLSVRKLLSDIFSIVIYSPEISSEGKPGQFLSIKCSDGYQTFLRRPISICRTSENDMTVEFIFQVKGKGTQLLSEKVVGDYLDIIGPVGKGFDVVPEYKNAAIIGGGIGIFPMLFLLDRMPNAEKETYLGFRDKESIILEKEFSKKSDNIYISTDNGTYGFKGNITQLFENNLKMKKPDIVYTCGIEDSYLYFD
jgi:dihydroorotate dehydrogenase electron transfer subunit